MASCSLCDSRLYIFEEIDEGPLNGMYNPSYESNTMAICSKCPTYYCLCPKCSVGIEDQDTLDIWYETCQFLGHDDFDKRHNNKEDMISYESKNINYCYTPDIKNGKNNHLTGDDGGYFHYWRCNKCKIEYEHTDK